MRPAGRDRQILALLTRIVLLIAGATAASARCGSAPPDTDNRIGYYKKKIAQDERHYPSYALIGATYLQKARETHDPAYLARARSALRRSLEIQPNFVAVKAMAAVCDYAHRFEDALGWGKQARETAPNDPEVTALLVEAYLGLGREDESGRLLPPRGEPPADYYTALAVGQWHAAQKRWDDATEAFLTAARFAEDAHIPRAVVSAKVRAAGALLDAGRPDAARPRLEEAAKLDPSGTALRLHQAELLEIAGKPDEALAAYEALFADDPDPEVALRAFILAKRIGGDSPRARRHFEVAKAAFRRAIEAGEIYTLGALARLYCEADVELDEARQLAERNLEYKRDAEARAVLAEIRKKLERRGQSRLGN